MKKLTLISLSFLLFSSLNLSANNTETNSTIQIPTDTSQLILVSTSDWSTKEANLQRYERNATKWQKIGKSINLVIGRNGLGWGKGLHITPKNAKYIKKEGDGKAPAGLFSLGHGFGYTSTGFTMNFPYANYKKSDHCVDDSHSQWYNQIIDAKETVKDYKSFEHMKLNNNLYKYGITVNHNPQQIAQAGSCIFIHIKHESGRGTAGCTAMLEDEIITILKWLDEEKKPLLLQLPQEEMVKVKLN
ncbi:MAG: Gll0911 protein [uncultured Sulfurovum sp.]|uniref:Gll0911 protein n=1 Tax=uncultured Sulfurovum sp. TaxID=269237 RepID=A0A6S6U0U3_9BACT|nr:MAG: Gll0911 protein [uncultured Sulfurovum sp.]